MLKCGFFGERCIGGILFFFLWFWAGCLHLPPVASLQLKNEAHHFVLENGLEVVLDPVVGHGEVVSHLYYRVGEADLKHHESGMAHLTEHLMFEGSGHVANGNYDRLLNSVGGQSAAYTTHDAIVFTARFPPEAIDLLLFLESDRMGWLCAGLTETDVENQKMVVNQESLKDMGSRYVQLGQLLRSMVFQDSPLSRDPGGELFQLENHDLKGICQFAQNWIHPQNAILTLSGHFEATKTEKAVRHWFSDVPSPKSALALHKGWQNARIPISRSMKTSGAYKELLVGWSTVSRGHPDALALNLILDRLAHPSDGLLTKRKIKSRGSVDYTRLGGMFYLHLSGWSHEKLIEELEDSFSEMRTLDDSDLRLSHYRRRAAYVRAWGDLEVRARLLSSCVEMNKQLDCIQQHLENELAVSSSDIRKVIDKWLSRKRRFTLFVSPFEELDGKP